MERREKIKEVLKKCWGLYPLLFVLLCVAIVAAIEKITGDTLRSVPRMVLMCMGVCSIGVAFLWADIRIIFKKFRVRFLGVFLKIVIPILSLLLFIYICFLNQFLMVFSYCPEHIVLYNGTKMVASVDSFLDVDVNYYQYKNALFYGKQLVYEYYGSGGYDPFDVPDKPDPVRWTIYDLDGNVVENGP